MDLPKRILVAVDFSPTADAALDYAIDFAKKLGAGIIVVHAYELPIVGFPDGALLATADIASRILNASQEALDATVRQRLERGVEMKKVLRQGVPWEEVHAVADEEKADLIVIGTHGRRGLARALLGSVAERVIRTAKRPVLVVHGPGAT